MSGNLDADAVSFLQRAKAIFTCLVFIDEEVDKEPAMIWKILVVFNDRLVVVFDLVRILLLFLEDFLAGARLIIFLDKENGFEVGLATLEGATVAVRRLVVVFDWVQLMLYCLEDFLAGGRFFIFLEGRDGFEDGFATAKAATVAVRRLKGLQRDEDAVEVLRITSSN